MTFSRILIFLGVTVTSWAQDPLQRAESPIPAKVESIYEKGLSFLAETQNEKGCWGGGYNEDPGVVGLAIMAFLAHGEDPNHGPYSTVIQNGLGYILESQDPKNGYFGSSMYSHGFATLALSEAYGAVDNEEIPMALDRAVSLILSSQKGNPTNGWRYNPEDTSSDTSIAGCQLVALYAARNAGIPVPDSALRKALDYMRSCRDSKGRYGYSSKFGPRETLSAIGLLCESLAKEKDTKGYERTTEFLRETKNHRESGYPFYYEYYMAQALFQADQELWEEWNARNTELLGAIQSSNGSFSSRQGTTFGTAGALLSLALNYRLLPIYEQ